MLTANGSPIAITSGTVSPSLASTIAPELGFTQRAASARKGPPSLGGGGASTNGPASGVGALPPHAIITDPRTPTSKRALRMEEEEDSGAGSRGKFEPGKPYMGAE